MNQDKIVFWIGYFAVCLVLATLWFIKWYTEDNWSKVRGCVRPVFHSASGASTFRYRCADGRIIAVNIPPEQVEELSR